MMGIMYTPFAVLARKRSFEAMEEICFDMLDMHVRNAWILPGESEDKVGLKKYYAADDPRGFKTVGETMHGLTSWVTPLLLGVEAKYYDRLDGEAKARYWDVRDNFTRIWPKTEESKWDCLPYGLEPERS
jgi:hypothetical protein